MARAIGGWLTGPPVAAGEAPGVRLGLPESGPGSVATAGARVGAFIIDAIVANLLAGVPYLFGVHYDIDVRNFAVFGAFLLVEFLFDLLYGQTIGKRMLNIRVIRVDGNGLGKPQWLLLRTVLLGVLIPAVVWDRDRRGLHDRASGTVVVVDPNLVAKSPPAKRPVAGKPASVTAPAPAPVRTPGPSRQPKKAPAGGPAKRKRRR
jgi:uncharacterized RDD family membrane protein YckC